MYVRSFVRILHSEIGWAKKHSLIRIWVTTRIRVEATGQHQQAQQQQQQQQQHSIQVDLRRHLRQLALTLI